MSTPTKKHIVILGPAHPLRGGLASYDERLAREFNRQGHRAEIFTFSLQYPDFVFPGQTQYSSEPAPEDLKISVRVNSINPFNWLITGRALKKMAPDIIVVRYWLPLMGPCLGTILRIARKNKKTKVVCIADNVIPHEKRPGDKPFTKYFLNSCDAFITMSEKVMEDLRLFQKEKPARFIAHPLYDNFGEAVSKESAREYLHLNATDPILLFFGFIRNYKGLDILLEAMHLLDPAKVPANLKLMVAGEFYEDEKPYRELIEKYQLTDRLILRTQFIPDSEVKYYLCAADGVIQPYRNATQSGVTPLAYHFEKPMIVTNAGGLPSLVPHRKAGLVAEPNPQALADAIAEYFQLGEASFLTALREEKKKYLWSNMTEGILGIVG